MMVPVVFLVLPVTVFFAFWPGVVGLSLTTPLTASREGTSHGPRSPMPMTPAATSR